MMMFLGGWLLASAIFAAGWVVGARLARITMLMEVKEMDKTINRPVHNHGPEGGPGLECRESLIGDCLRFGSAPGGEVREVKMKLSETEYEVLRELTPHPDYEWYRPMDVGGSDGSHHSYTLRRLCERGLVERETRSAYLTRPSYRYRITPEGLAALEAAHV